MVNPNQTFKAIDELDVDADPKDVSLSLTPSNKTFDINRVILNARISGGASVNDYKVKFYNGNPASGGNEISQDMWLSCQPPEGYSVIGTVKSDIYMRVTGHTAGTLKIQANVHYTWR